MEIWSWFAICIVIILTLVFVQFIIGISDVYDVYFEAKYRNRYRERLNYERENAKNRN